MSLSSDLNKHIYVGNGVTKTFDYEFDVLTEDDLHIYLTNTINGTEVEITSNYSVSPSEGTFPSSNGIVTYPSIGTAISSDYKLTIIRTLEVLQPTVYPNNTALKPKVVERSFDRITMIAQQQQEQIDRTLQFAITVPDDFSRSLPAPVALKALRINSDATAFEYTTDPEIAANQAAASAAAALASENSSATSETNAATSAATIGGFLDYTATAKTLDIITKKDIRSFGAIGDLIADDTDAIQAALDYVDHGGSVYFPPHDLDGGYLISDTLVLTKNDVKFITDNKAEYTPRLVCTTTGKTMLHVKGYGFTMKGLSFKGDGDGVTPATVNALLLDRETDANIDAEITNCNFLYLNKIATANGRNAFFYYNTFSVCNYGIDFTVFPSQECRGHRINHNRFHSIGLNGVVTDSKCIAMPVENDLCYGNEVINNVVDYCGIFYYGQVNRTVIDDNQIYNAYGGLIDTGVAATTRNQEGISSISDNFLAGLYSFASAPISFIKISKHGYLKVDGNTFRNCKQIGIDMQGCYAFSLKNNYIINPNLKYTDDSSLTYDGIVLDSACSNWTIDSNFIRSSLGTPGMRYGINLTSCPGTDSILGINNIYGSQTSVVVYPNASNLMGLNTTRANDLLTLLKPNTGGVIGKFGGSRAGQYSGGMTFNGVSASVGAEKVGLQFDVLYNGSTATPFEITWDKITKTTESAWNGGHTQMGVYHLWVDSSGRLRIKSGSPTSDTDGTIVGAQT